jgi:serine-type D-Ala-D-Ala carboxypeptidase (penicillin-binding protein 5/6)
MINENKLLWRDPSITGMKTGYTAAAGNCLVASASRNGRDLIGVILKAPGGEIYPDMQALLEYGFTQYQNHIYKEAGETIAQTQIQNQIVNLLAQQPIWVSQKKGEPFHEPNIKVVPVSSNISSVEAGQVLTQLEIWEGEERISLIPLSADRSVKPEAVRLKSSKWLSYLLIFLAVGLLIEVSRRKTYVARRLNRTRRRRSESNYDS